MMTTNPSRRPPRRRAATLALLALVTVPNAIQSASQARAAVVAQPLACSAAGNGIVPTPAISFGRQGGNIRPMKVSIADSGTITYDGANPVTTTYTISAAAVQGLQRLAGAEGFWSMPSLASAPGVLPDIATRFISLRMGCSTATYTVRVHGGGVPAFDELYDTLTAATGIVAIPVAPTPNPIGQNGPQTITLQNAGESLAYTIGTRVLVQLGTTYSWTLHFSNPSIFTRVPNYLLIRGAQGLFAAARQGQTTLTAVGDPACRLIKPACALPSRSFQVTLVAQPPIQP